MQDDPRGDAGNDGAQGAGDRPPPDRDPAALPLQYFAAPDGARLAYRELGAGRTVVLLHGFLSSAADTWIRPGHAAAIAAAGYRVVLPDLRAHGESAAPRDASAYPPDVLARDGAALLSHLGFGDGRSGGYDLSGYSLGGRTVVRMLLSGLRPDRAVVGGQGADSLDGGGGTRVGAMFREVVARPGSFPEDSREYRMERYVRRIGADPQALLHLLDSSVMTGPDRLPQIVVPTLVLKGEEDDRSAAELARLLPDAKLVLVPGGHMGAVNRPDRLGQEVAAFLGPGAAFPSAR